jgi:hypothetical protein
MFGHGAPFLRPTVQWLARDSLMALLNSQVNDFILRTFIGSRMNVHPGDIRRLPIPVLSQEQNAQLSGLAERAVEEKAASEEGGSSRLRVVEDEINQYVGSLYGVASDADLWVVR